MKNLSIMIKPASSLCNLRCKYCFYADISNLRDVASFGLMSEQTMQEMLKKIEMDLNPGDRITIAFQGGEPTLAGLNYFRKFVEIVSGWDSRIHVAYALQTNAILLDDDWCSFFAEHRFLLGISLDLLPDCHDAARVDEKGEGTYKRILQSVRCLEQHHVEYNVLCTLTNQVARHPQQVWKQILKLDLHYVQFTPCLDELENPGESAYALTPKRFASFYTEIFRFWLEDFKKGRYRSIKLFDDVVNQLALGIRSACGMGGSCSPQIIVEADGSVYPCDFYCLDKYKLGNITELSPTGLLASGEMKAFLKREHRRPELCGGCMFVQLCGGGCKRMQRETCCSGEDSFCGYCEFLKECIKDLNQIAMAERRTRGY